MFKKCQHCGSIFKGTENFCSDMCEIKSYTPMVVKLEAETISLETKEELNQATEIHTEIPIPTQKIIEKKENQFIDHFTPKTN